MKILVSTTARRSHGLRLDRGGPVRFDPGAVRSAVLRLLAEAPFRARAEDMAGEIAVQPHTHGAVQLFKHLAA